MEELKKLKYETRLDKLVKRNEIENYRIIQKLKRKIRALNKY